MVVCMCRGAGVGVRMHVSGVGVVLFIFKLTDVNLQRPSSIL